MFNISEWRENLKGVKEHPWVSLGVILLVVLVGVTASVGTGFFSEIGKSFVDGKNIEDSPIVDPMISTEEPEGLDGEMTVSGDLRFGNPELPGYSVDINEFTDANGSVQRDEWRVFGECINIKSKLGIFRVRDYPPYEDEDIPMLYPDGERINPFSILLTNISPRPNEVRLTFSGVQWRINLPSPVVDIYNNPSTGALSILFNEDVSSDEAYYIKQGSSIRVNLVEAE